MTDRETTAAVEALTHRIRARDTLEEISDAEVFALEFITALRARGWRPTEAKVMPAWHRPAGHGVEPTGDYLAARQALDARLACREPGGGDAA
jgi:hypothetical protein